MGPPVIEIVRCNFFFAYGKNFKRQLPTDRKQNRLEDSFFKMCEPFQFLCELNSKPIRFMKVAKHSKASKKFAVICSCLFILAEPN